MKKDINPEYKSARISCVCGNVIQTRSTKGDYEIQICAKCHPFFTGKQKFVDTAGRVERFQRRYAKFDAERQTAEAKAAAEPTAAPKPEPAPEPAPERKPEPAPERRPAPPAEPKPEPASAEPAESTDTLPESTET